MVFPDHDSRPRYWKMIDSKKNKRGEAKFGDKNVTTTTFHAGLEPTKLGSKIGCGLNYMADLPVHEITK